MSTGQIALIGGHTAWVFLYSSKLHVILGINLGTRCLTVHHVVLVKLHSFSDFCNCFKNLLNYRHKQVLHNSTANVMTSVNPLSPHIVKVIFCSVSHSK